MSGSGGERPAAAEPGAPPASGGPGEVADAALPDPLLAFAPLLYSAWVDAALSDSEIDALRVRVAADTRLTDAHRAALDAWLDPDRPPPASALERLRERVRGEDRPERPDSLAELGAAIAGDAPHTALLNEMESAIGVVAADAARAIATADRAAPQLVAPAQAASFDPRRLYRFIDGDHTDVRERTLALIGRPEFADVDPHDIPAYRKRVLDWCRILADEGLGALAYPSEFGGDHEVARSIAAFETLAFGDLSLLVKFGVQFGLFAGSIYQLGTRWHHETFLGPAVRLELPGCFAMTETAHGSNVRDIRTTATWDAEIGGFIIHTPEPSAAKDYIGNAAQHGRLAIVFAQLRIGAQHHGVHAFLVPIRDVDGALLHGVDIEDCGLKEGLNGVDNGRIRFNHVSIPRRHLLDRFGHVDRSGVYFSPIPSPARRFFTMLGTLVAGRISIASASVSAAKVGLTIATRYAANRRQFGPEGGDEVPILDYLAVQQALLPRIAATFVLDSAMKSLIRRFSSAGKDTREIESLAAGFKAYASRHAVETVQACRELCAGQGYLEVNRLPALRADTDVFTTFEGANPVLLQLVAKGLLTEYREAFGEIKLWGVARMIAARAAAAFVDRNPFATRRTDEDHLRDPDFHSAMFEAREDRLLASLARRLNARIDDGLDSFAAFNDCQDHALSLARAHIERVAFDAFRAAYAAAGAELQPVLLRLGSLWALGRFDRDAAWFLEKGYVEPAKLRAIRRESASLLAEIRPDAVALVDAFGIPSAVLRAPIAALP